MKLIPVSAADVPGVLDGSALGRIGAAHGVPGLHAGRGWPHEDSVPGLSFIGGGGRTWLVVDDDGAVIGELGTKAPPVDRRVEIGYGLAGPARGRGQGTAAVRLLLGELADDPSIDTVEAFVSPANEPSARLLRRLGFRAVGHVSGEDRFLLDLPVLTV